MRIWEVEFCEGDNYNMLWDKINFSGQDLDEIIKKAREYLKETYSDEADKEMKNFYNKIAIQSVNFLCEVKV